MHKSLYLGLDAHTRICVLAAMDPSGRVIYSKSFSTSESALIRHVMELPARSKHLALEESSLAGWIASVLRPYVTRLIVCDPRHNTLISRGNKDDHRDAADLCRLLRLEELVEVFHPDQEDRVDFKIMAQQYLRFTRDRASLKSQIKSKYHQAGLTHVVGTQVFSKTHRVSYLKQLPTNARRSMMKNLYDHFDKLDDLRDQARTSMVEQGKRYPEIAELRRMPGIGVVGSHVFSAFIQTPHRFATKPNFANCSVIKIRIFYIPDCGIFFRGIPDFVISQMGWERFREVQTLVFAGFAALLLCRSASNSPGRTQLLLLHLEFLFSTRRNDFDSS